MVNEPFHYCSSELSFTSFTMNGSGLSRGSAMGPGDRRHGDAPEARLRGEGRGLGRHRMSSGGLKHERVTGDVDV